MFVCLSLIARVIPEGGGILVGCFFLLPSYLFHFWALTSSFAGIDGRDPGWRRRRRGRLGLEKLALLFVARLPSHELARPVAVALLPAPGAQEQLLVGGEGAAVPAPLFVFLFCSRSSFDELAAALSVGGGWVGNSPVVLVLRSWLSDPPLSAAGADAFAGASLITVSADAGRTSVMARQSERSLI